MATVSTAKVLARLILRLSPLIIDATQTVRKWRKKGDVPIEDIPSRVERLEKNMDLQSNLNEQFITDMQVLKSALEEIHTSIKFVFYLALLACVFSLVALVLHFLK
ncbi:MAG TPA: hypothetical protein VMM54_03405 [Nitrospirota bacterium]|nr:hypothetical protein [Nitrospirota bacterium]